MLAAVFSVFPGWHLQLKRPLSSWCLKDDSPVTILSGLCFPHLPVLGELFRPSVPFLEDTSLSETCDKKGWVRRWIACFCDNSRRRHTDFWKWEVFGFHDLLLNSHQCGGQRICPILLKEPLPQLVFAVYGQNPQAISLALSEMSK